MMPAEADHAGLSVPLILMSRRSGPPQHEGFAVAIWRDA